ncbi:MAG: PKD domain-containing protein, partial [Gemmataceae bacterium]
MGGNYTSAPSISFSGGSATTQATGAATIAAAASLAGQPLTTSFRFVGALDETAFFNRALTPAEIQAQFNARSSGAYSSTLAAQAPVAYYRLGDTNPNQYPAAPSLLLGAGASDQFGAAVAGLASGKIVVGTLGDDAPSPVTSNLGAIHIFDSATGNLVQSIPNQFPMHTGAAQFGQTLVTVGNYIVVGTPFEDVDGGDMGLVQVFDGTTGALLRELQNPNVPAVNSNTSDRFGSSLAAVGTDKVLVGAPFNDRGATDAGAAYLFDVTTGQLLATFQNPNPHGSDQFGTALAASGNRLAVSAPFVDAGLALDVGAVYTFSTQAALVTSRTSRQQGGVTTLTGAFTDAGLADSHTVTVNWGDGNTSTVSVPSLPQAATVPLSAPYSYGGHTYYAIKDGALTWQQAETQAQLMGGHLVAINSVGENQFVIETLRKEYGSDLGAWIGASDRAANGAFAWANGDPIVFARWATGQPGSTAGVDGAAINRLADGTTLSLGAWATFTSAQTFAQAIIEIDGTRNFSATHQYATDGSYNISVTVTDKDNAGSAAGATTTIVTNAAPTVTINNLPASSPEATTISLTSSVSDPGGPGGGFTYAWSVTKNGAPYNPGTQTDPDPSHFTFTPNDNGSYVVSLTVTATDGGASTTSKTVTVTNLAPLVTAPPHQRAGQGVATTLSLGSFADPGPDSPWSVDVNWGDGSSHTTFTTTTTGALGSRTHTFAANGNFTVTVTVTDKDGASAANTFQVVMPVVTVADQSAGDGFDTPFNLGSFADPDTVGPWAVDVDWGDGSSHTTFNTSSPGLLGSRSHTYAKEGQPYTAVVTVTSQDGVKGIGVFHVAVANVAPTIRAADVSLSATAITEGDATTLTGFFFDPSAQDTHTVTINWGDGSSPDVIPLAAGVLHFSKAHPYADDFATGFANIVVSVSDGSSQGVPDLLVGGYDTNSVFRFNGAIGAFEDAFVPTAGPGNGGLTAPDLGFVIGPDGNLYVGGSGSNNVLRYDGATGAPLPSPGNSGAVFVPAGSGGLARTEGIAFGPDGSLYVGSSTGSPGSYTGSILRFDGVAGAFLGTFVQPGSGGLQYTDDVHFGPDGNLYVSDFAGNTVLRFRGSDGSPLPSTGNSGATFIPAGSGGLSVANGFTFGRDGNIYLASAGDSSVKRYSGTTGAFIDTFVPSGSGGLSYGDGIVFGPDGNLYVAGARNILVYDGSTGAFLRTFVPAGSGGLGAPSGLAFLTSSVTTRVAVSNLPPAATINNAPAGSPEGTRINLASTVTDPSSVDTAAGFTYAWSVTKNGASYNPGTQTDLDPSHFSFTPNDDGAYVVTLTATDKNGGVGTDSRTIRVANVAPTTAITGAPATGPEGTALSLAGAVTDPGSVDTAAGFTYVWRVTKNSVAYNPSAQTDPDPSHFRFTPNDDGVYVVTLTAIDKNGGVGTDTKTISVANVAPTATITGAPATSPEGTAISLAGTVTDPSSVDTAAGFTYAWSVTKNGASYDDHSGAPTNQSGFTFTPDDNATYVVTLTATDKNGGVGSDSKTISVTNVAPTPVMHGATVADVVPTGSPEGTGISLTSTVSDPSSVDSAAGFTYAWSVTKNGAPYNPGTQTDPDPSHFSFTPDDNGTYIVTLAVADKDQTPVGIDQKTITVTNVAPTPSISEPNAPSIHYEGTPIDLTGAATDPSGPGSPDTQAKFLFAWSVTKTKNGVTTAFGTPYTANTRTDQTSYSFTPDDDATYVVTLAATDKDGDLGAKTFQVQVDNVAPTATGLTNSGPVPEGGSAIVSFTGPFHDVSQADTDAGFTFLYDFDNDGIFDPVIVNGVEQTHLTSVTVDSKYLQDGPGARTVHAAIIDKDGGQTDYYTTIDITNAAPTVAVTPPPDITQPDGTYSAVRGQPLTFTVGAQDPGALDQAAGFSYDIDWGDLTQSIAGVAVGLDAAHNPIGGSGYTDGAVVTFSGGGGSGAKGRVVVDSHGAILRVVMTNQGSGYLLAPTVNVAGPGSGAALTAVLGDLVVAPAPGNGAGVDVTHIYKQARATPYHILVTARDKDGRVGAVSQTDIGIASATVVGDNLLVGASTDGSAIYVLPATSGGNVTVTSQFVQSVTVTNHGSGYTAPPTVVFTGGDGSGAAATAVIGIGVAGIAITDGGSGYLIAPTVTFSGGGGSGAAGTAVIDGAGVVTGVLITSAGSGYTSTPTIAFSDPPSGSTATGTAVLTPTGAVIQVNMTSPGEGYTSTPTVTFTGGGGTGAAATANLGGDTVTRTAQSVQVFGQATLDPQGVAKGIKIVAKDSPTDVALTGSGGAGDLLVGPDAKSATFNIGANYAGGAAVSIVSSQVASNITIDPATRALITVSDSTGTREINFAGAATSLGSLGSASGAGSFGDGASLGTDTQLTLNLNIQGQAQTINKAGAKLTLHGSIDKVVTSASSSATIITALPTIDAGQVGKGTTVVSQGKDAVFTTLNTTVQAGNNSAVIGLMDRASFDAAVAGLADDQQGDAVGGVSKSFLMSAFETAVTMGFDDSLLAAFNDELFAGFDAGKLAGLRNTVTLQGAGSTAIVGVLTNVRDTSAGTKNTVVNVFDTSAKALVARGVSNFEDEIAGGFATTVTSAFDDAFAAGFDDITAAGFDDDLIAAYAGKGSTAFTHALGSANLKTAFEAAYGGPLSTSAQRFEDDVVAGFDAEVAAGFQKRVTAHFDDAMQAAYQTIVARGFDASIVAGFDNALQAAFEDDMVAAFDDAVQAAFDDALEAAFAAAGAIDPTHAQSFEDELVAAYNQHLPAGFDNDLTAAFKTDLVTAFGTTLTKNGNFFSDLLNARFDAVVRPQFNTSVSAGYDDVLEAGFNALTGTSNNGASFSATLKQANATTGKSFDDEVAAGFDAVVAAGFDDIIAGGFDDAIDSGFDADLVAAFKASGAISAFETALGKGFSDELVAGFDDDLTAAFRQSTARGFDDILAEGFQEVLRRNFQDTLRQGFDTALDAGFEDALVAAFNAATSSLAGINVTSGGSGYSAPPTVTFSGGGGTGATATAVLGKGVASITVTNGGSYATAPAVTFTGDGVGAAGTAILDSNGAVIGVDITSAGSGYTSPPTITFAPSDNGGATATGSVILADTGSVVRVDIVNAGTGYTSAPTISFSGGGASATALLRVFTVAQSRQFADAMEAGFNAMRHGTVNGQRFDDAVVAAYQLKLQQRFEDALTQGFDDILTGAFRANSSQITRFDDAAEAGFQNLQNAGFDDALFGAFDDDINAGFKSGVQTAFTTGIKTSLGNAFGTTLVSSFEDDLIAAFDDEVASGFAGTLQTSLKAAFDDIVAGGFDDVLAEGFSAVLGQGFAVKIQGAYSNALKTAFDDALISAFARVPDGQRQAFEDAVAAAFHPSASPPQQLRFDDIVAGGFGTVLSSLFTQPNVLRRFDDVMAHGFEDDIVAAFDNTLGKRFDDAVYSGFDDLVAAGFDDALDSGFAGKAAKGFDDTLVGAYATDVQSGFDDAVAAAFNVHVGTASHNFADDLFAGFEEDLAAGFDKAVRSTFDDALQGAFDDIVAGGFSGALAGGFDDALLSAFQKQLTVAPTGSTASRFDDAVEAAFQSATDRAYQTLVASGSLYGLTSAQLTSFKNDLSGKLHTMLSAGFKTSLLPRFDADVASGFGQVISRSFEDDVTAGFENAVDAGFRALNTPAFNLALQSGFDGELAAGYKASLPANFETDLIAGFENLLNSNNAPLLTQLQSLPSTLGANSFEDDLFAAFENDVSAGFETQLKNRLGAALQTAFDDIIDGGFSAALSSGFEDALAEGFQKAAEKQFDAALSAALDQALANVSGLPAGVDAATIRNALRAAFDDAIDGGFHERLAAHFDDELVSGFLATLTKHGANYTALLASGFGVGNTQFEDAVDAGYNALAAAHFDDELISGFEDDVIAGFKSTVKGAAFDTLLQQRAGAGFDDTVIAGFEDDLIAAFDDEMAGGFDDAVQAAFGDALHKAFDDVATAGFDDILSGGFDDALAQAYAVRLKSGFTSAVNTAFENDLAAAFTAAMTRALGGLPSGVDRAAFATALHLSFDDVVDSGFD